MALFPLISLPETSTGGGNKKLFRETAWDFKNNVPIWRGGEPVYVTGAPAVLVWAWNALQTQRKLYDIFTRDYGQGIRELTGKAYTAAVQQSEAVRYIRECLLVNPYITAVDQVSIELIDNTLVIGCLIHSIYGEVTVDGCRV